MSKFRRFAVTFIIVEVLLVILVNLFAIKKLNYNAGAYYKVDVSRIEARLKNGEAIENIDCAEYPSIVEIHQYEPENEKLYKYSYVVKKINGELLCFEYEQQNNNRIFVLINALAAAIILANVILLIYIDRKMITPFSKMNKLTTELAKGNLSVPIKQEKSKYFGKFLWGMDMLRETLEDDKKRELKLQKEKKTLILSLSHDIKTPLSAIDLYAKALKRDLYETEEEKAAAFEGIEKNIGEIKKYVKEITEASREDFLNLEVNVGDVYLSRVIDYIREYYDDKMRSFHTEFDIEIAEDCLIKGDFDRIIEVLQNIIENAIKYGDGRKITLSVDEEENCKLISVINTGCKLAEDELPHLFDSFYRGSNSDKQEGSGLGLYICRQLMHMMDGEIFAKVQNDTFCITMVIQKC